MRQIIGSARRLVILVALGVLTLAALRVALSRRTADHSRVSLTQSEYLRDVVEPISMVVGMSADDGGSLVLVFKDSRQVNKSICLLNNLVGEQNLIFGTDVPDSRGKEKLPLGGPGELALLGLLERWHRQDPDARSWDERFEQRELSGHQYNILRADDTKEQIGKAIAIGVMRRLRDRN